MVILHACLFAYHNTFTKNEMENSEHPPLLQRALGSATQFAELTLRELSKILLYLSFITGV